MKYKETILKVAIECCRLLIGVVFIFSGTVKSIDPMGFAIKIGEYLASFGLDKLEPFHLFLSINLSAVEFTLGVCMLFGVYRRYTSFLVLVFMLFMTPLTLYLALYNPVSDCGCFGDAIIISNWETFFKNIVLLAAAIFLFVYHRRIYQVYTIKAYWFVALFAYLFSVIFAWNNYSHLPVIDFRPYKTGANIPSLMTIPKGAPEDEYSYSFLYQKDGVTKEFPLENLPDSTWTFVESKTKLIKQGYIPPVETFHIYNKAGDEVTGELFDAPNGVLLLIAPKLEKADDSHIDEINNVYDYAVGHDLMFYCVTGSSPDAIHKWMDMTGAEYPFLMADETLLKTIIRSNPGLVLLKNGTVLAKWHNNDIPEEEYLKQEIDNRLQGNNPSKEEHRFAHWIIPFIVPLGLVWIYDSIRNRRRKKTVQKPEEKSKKIV